MRAHFGLVYQECALKENERLCESEYHSNIKKKYFNYERQYLKSAPNIDKYYQFVSTIIMQGQLYLFSRLI